MKELHILNPEKASEADVKNYYFREAARAIVVDQNGKVALLFVAKDNHYKLPGGGVEYGEDLITALRRECREELGSEIEVVGEIGSIVEYRKYERMKQVSYCYLAKTKGQPGRPKFTAEELAVGFQTIWLPYEEAKLRIAISNTFEGKNYIVPRDRKFLQAASKYIP